MAINRLTDNDISSLAKIFETILQSYCKGYSPMEKDYFKELNTIMGLGFTTALVDGDLLLSIFERRLKTFIQYRNFKEHPGAIGILSRAIAETIDVTLYLFQIKERNKYLDKRPRYYKIFIDAVRKAIEDISLHDARKTEEAERLMKILFQNSH